MYLLWACTVWVYFAETLVYIADPSIVCTIICRAASIQCTGIYCLICLLYVFTFLIHTSATHIVALA